MDVLACGFREPRPNDRRSLSAHSAAFANAVAEAAIVLVVPNSEWSRPATPSGNQTPRQSHTRLSAPYSPQCLDHGFNVANEAPTGYVQGYVEGCAIALQAADLRKCKWS
jgi:hypothetical protein